MSRGYGCPLHILPFDHGGFFQSRMFVWNSPPCDAQTAEIAGTERVVRCIVLGRGAANQQVGDWLEIAAAFGVLADLRLAAPSSGIHSSPGAANKPRTQAYLPSLHRA